MNEALTEVLTDWTTPAIWGLVATALMTSVLESAQLFGLSRLSLPFLFGTFVVGDRRRAMIFGYLLYLVGGWLFAFLYSLTFATVGRSDWWFGLLLGTGHGLFLVSVFLPALPFVHPRIATEYDNPSSRRRLEPPGAFGLHYGRMTPFVTVVGQALFGVVLALAH